MPSTRVRVRVPLCGSTISQTPTITVSSAQIKRRTTVPIEWAEKAAATRKAPAMSEDPADEDRRPDRGDGGHEDRDAADDDREDADRHQRLPAPRQPLANLRVHRRSSHLHAPTLSVPADDDQP